ncbi:chemotaxis response regulator protein-glutamate methylesterase [Clostridium sp. 'deep sea']|uniref:protein-glutamate methylesterase/protein-glutamine glutaminase n=1 Tax=Clostridium sp. 'deep sea' TaxID=2779445 RepID=UPI0018965366|nr:chemotaxis response regulator protein-glutamate methylesterase [Clostridium sp. 'deep sea']QOR35337.1 chemotaxis response regulator protein-glutamate methylesterase [Clostridium sp. 'deep sea']
MKKRKKLRVLIADDSALFRAVLEKKLSADQDIEIVAKAANPYEARDMIIKHRPDVMTLDVEMPKMNGIEFVKKLMPQYPMPIVMVSSLNDTVFDALNAGAVDFVNKPSSSDGVDMFIKELIVKIKIASTVNVGDFKHLNKKVTSLNEVNYNSDIRLIAIGASTGGTIAVSKVLKGLTRGVPGIVIVQHMPPVFTKMFAERMNNECLLAVKEAEDGDEITPGRAFIAPGDSHIRVTRKGSKYIIKTEKYNEKNKVNGHCPSVDVLFNSVSQNVRDKAIGVILTGMGKDGALGLKRMKASGAITIGQDQSTSVVYGMPKVAYDLGAVKYQLPIEQISEKIQMILKKN